MTDAEETVLVEDELLSETVKGSQAHDIEVDDQSVKEAVLPRQPGMTALISQNVFDTIDAAVSASVPPERVSVYREAADEFFCSLPPVLDLPALLDIAEGVLEGRPGDIRQFDEILNNLEAWNHRHYSHTRHRLTVEEAEMLLDDDFLEALSDHLATNQNEDRASLLSQRGIGVLTAAAIRISSDDPLRTHRNIGILSEQFCGIGQVGPLYFAAQNALSGDATQRREFLNTLEIYGGLCDDSGVGELSPPFGGGSPLPVPCPEGPPWPPDPDEPFTDFPEEVDCEVEFIIAVKEALQRGITYSISDISPPRACPGDTITITGSNLVFEGNTGIVLFPSLRRGSPIPATPESWTDTEIEVVVPAGAVCGELELDIPVGATLLACDSELELFHGPADPVMFLGGDTVIRYFDFTPTPPSGCLDVGEDVSFLWNACNADRTRLTVTDPIGELLDEAVFGEGSAGENQTYTFTVPSRGEDVTVTATLEISGPCGERTRTLEFDIRADPDVRPDEPVTFTDFTFRNWHRNIVSESMGTFAPTTLDELVRAVRTAEADGFRLGVMGNRCSFTNCIIPRPTASRLIESTNLNKLLNLDPDVFERDEFEVYSQHAPLERIRVVPDGLRRTGIQSVFSGDVEDEYAAVTGRRTPIDRRLVHVEAGIRMADLNCLLDVIPIHTEGTGLALATMGGGARHALAGAFSTGTHGATTKLPPIADYVRAIHLVGPGGQQWWIEPESRPITDPDRMNALKGEDGGLDPCVDIIYDDDLFYATLVSFGNAGIIYAVVIETVDAHNIRSETRGVHWDEAKEELSEAVIDAAPQEHWFVEATVNPTQECRLTTMNLTADPVDLPAEGPELGEVLLDVLSGIVGRILRLIPRFIASQLERIASLLLRPWRWGEILDIRNEIELIRDLGRAIGDLFRIIGSGFDDEEIAAALPNLFNLIWRITAITGSGRDLIEEIQSIYTTHFERPRRTGVGPSFLALTQNWQGECPPSSLSEPSPFEQLIQSSEYGLPAERGLAFVDAIFEKTDEMRDGTDAIIVIVNLRFTQSTRALVGMQQFPLTCHVEIFTPRGMDGNAELHAHIHRLADSFEAVPHWGQLHADETRYERVYSNRLAVGGANKLPRWQRAMDRIATESSGGDPNTFRHNFAIERGLLSEL